MKKISTTSSLLLSGIILLMGGCHSNKNNKDSKLYFSNNIESSFAWNDKHAGNIVKSDDAHSGNYINKIDASNAFSETFNMKLSDVSSKPLRSVRISAWVKLSKMSADPLVVADIRDKNQNSLEWLSKPAKETVSTADKWEQVTMNVNLDDRNRNDPDNYLRIYVSNGEADYSLVDDIEIQFKEK